MRRWTLRCFNWIGHGILAEFLTQKDGCGKTTAILAEIASGRLPFFRQGGLVLKDLTTDLRLL